MSAFMVEDKTINWVVTWLRTELNDSNYLREQPQERLSMDVVEDSFVQELGQAMFQLNIEGVNTRYADKPAAQFRKLDYAYQTEFVSDVQVLKSCDVGCINAQKARYRMTRCTGSSMRS
jgi:hypothetical protein